MSSLLVVGSMAFDTVSTPADNAHKGIGGSATYFSAASGLLTNPEVIAVLGQDFDLSALDFLRERGVNLSGVKVKEGKTFHWHGSYGADLSEATTLATDLNVFEDFDPQLTEEQKDADFLFLANIIPSLQLSVLEQSRSKFIAADTMNLWINNKNADLRRVLSRINLLIVNEAEAKLLSGCPDVLSAAETITEMGPHIVIIKRGAYGAFMLYKIDGNSSYFSVPAYPTARLVDPTGCGDTFAGGVMGTMARYHRSDEDTLRRGIVVGTALASFTVEGFCLDGLKKADVPRLKKRCERIKKMICVPEIEI